jgi:hypothetical protein
LREGAWSPGKARKPDPAATLIKRLGGMKAGTRRLGELSYIRQRGNKRFGWAKLVKLKVGLTIREPSPEDLVWSEGTGK